MKNEKSFEEKINFELNEMKKLDMNCEIYEYKSFYKKILKLWKKSNERNKYYIEYMFQFYYENNRIIEDTYINENFDIKNYGKRGKKYHK
jgi:hypothetical protein